MRISNLTGPSGPWCGFGLQRLLPAPLLQLVQLIGYLPLGRIEDAAQ
jgi:hypothetical protein